MNKNITEDLSKKVYNATRWSAVTNILRKLVSPIVNMILARILLPSAFGVIATINIVISFADLFTDAGFQKYLVQHNFKDERELKMSTNVAFWTNFIFSMIIWIVIVIFRNNLARLVGSDGYGTHLAVAALSIPLLSFSSIQQALFKRNFDFKSMFIPSVINAIIPFLITIPLALVTKNCWALIIGTLVANLSDAILLTFKSKWKPKFFYSFSLLKEMFSFSMWSMIESLSIWVSLNIDVLILGNMISSYYLGLYKTSITSINQITSLITTTIIPILFSALSRVQNEEKDFQNTFYTFQKNVGLLLLPMCVGIFIYRDLITRILLGNNWLESSYMIGLMGLMQGLTILISNFSSEVYRAKGEPKVSFFVQLLFILIFVPLIFLGAYGDFSSLCNFRALALLLFAVVHLLILKIRYHFSLCFMAYNFFQPALISLIMALFGIVLQQYMSSLFMQFFSIFLCVIFYFALCMLFPKTKGDIKSLLAFFKK